MNTPRLLSLLTLSTLMLAALPAARADAADELDRAFEKLHQTSYRKREVWLGAAAAGTKPAITEYRGDRSRMVVETDVPGYGTVRQERVAVGRRAAVRTVAPGVTGRLDQARRSAKAHAARAVLGQVAGVGMAVATGGLGGKNVLHTVSSGVGVLNTAVQAHAAIGRANASFGTWQLVADDVDSDAGEFEAPLAEAMRVEKEYSEDPRQIRYRRVAAGDEDASTATIVIVSAATGVPIAEETIVNGQPMSRIEYFDIGAPIAIDLPDVLR